jgi:precorrin-6B methylase 2
MRADRTEKRPLIKPTNQKSKYRTKQRMNTIIEKKISQKRKPAAKGKAKTHKPTGLTPENIMRIGTGFFASKALLSAAELGLFTELAKGPLDAEALRARLGLHARSARDFFDALVALRLLDRKNGKYANTAETDLFLDRNKPGYIGGIMEMCSVRLFRDWASLTEALRTGEPQSDAKNGGKTFERLYETPAKLENFLGAMTGISLGSAGVIAEKFPWADHETFADVGTAQGALPVRVAQAHPHLHGIGCDLPVVKPVFEKYARKHGVEKRVRFHSLDFFKEPLPNVDVIVMGHILHDWNLEEKRVLIRKAYEALPKGGAFIVNESLIDDDRRENAFGLLMSLNMLVETPGGYDYTGADCQAWMREAGFRQTRVEHLTGPDSMVVGIK